LTDKPYDTTPMKMGDTISIAFQSAASSGEGFWECVSQPDELKITQEALDIGKPPSPAIIFNIVADKPGKYALKFERKNISEQQAIETRVFNIEFEP
jgi:hypothetical protein